LWGVASGEGFLKYAIVLALAVAIGAYIVLGPVSLEDFVPSHPEEKAAAAHLQPTPPASPASSMESWTIWSPSGSRRSKDGARSSPLTGTAPMRSPRGRRSRDGLAQRKLRRNRRVLAESVERRPVLSRLGPTDPLVPVDLHHSPADALRNGV
jgi:hypothetical protein